MNSVLLIGFIAVTIQIGECQFFNNGRILGGYFYPRNYPLLGYPMDAATMLGNQGAYDSVNHGKKSIYTSEESGLDSNQRENDKHSIGTLTIGMNDLNDVSSVKSSSGFGGISTGGYRKHEDGFRGGFADIGTTKYKNGHSNKGFHKSYSNVEDGKDSSYVDKGYNAGGEGHGKTYGKNYSTKGRQDWREAGAGEAAIKSATGRSTISSSLGSSGQHYHGAGTIGKDSSFKTGKYLIGDNRKIAEGSGIKTEATNGHFLNNRTHGKFNVEEEYYARKPQNVAKLSGAAGQPSDTDNAQYLKDDRRINVDGSLYAGDQQNIPEVSGFSSQGTSRLIGVKNDHSFGTSGPIFKDPNVIDGNDEAGQTFPKQIDFHNERKPIHSVEY